MNMHFATILQCPITKSDLIWLDDRQIGTLNNRIQEGDLYYLDGTPVRKTLTSAFASPKEIFIYPVEDDIMHNVVLPKCLEAGIMPRVYSSVRHDRMSIAPPLIIKKDELDRGLDIIYDVLADL